jgi:hypothetical protein
MANLLQGAPQGAAVILLDQDGTPHPIVEAFQAMSGGTDSEGQDGSCYLALTDNGVNGGWNDRGGTTLQDDPARIILSPAQPKTFASGKINTYFPGDGTPFTVASLLAAFGGGPNSVDGLISGPNTGDVPTNTSSPVALVQRVPTDATPWCATCSGPTLALVHGLYVDHERNRVLLAAF